MTEPALSPDYPASVVRGELRLPKAPGIIRQYWNRHPRLTDGLIAGVYAAPTLIGVLVAAIGPELQPVWLTVLQLTTVAGMGVALLFRRRFPWQVLGASWLACLAVFSFGAADVFPILLALYAVAVYRSTKAAWVGLAGSVVVGTVSVFISARMLSSADTDLLGDGGQAASVTQFAILMLVATLIGITVGNRRRYLGALIDRAHDLARERDQQAQLAAAGERERIAREMHDIVSHSLTVMVTLAEGSAATVERDAARATEAMRHVADTGRGALTEMRRMLGILTGPDDAGTVREPQPGAAAIPALIEGFRAAGLPVRLRSSGPVATEPALQLTIYRIVQEGLTNVLRHAPGSSSVDVDVEYHDDRVEITIEDDAVALGPRHDDRGGRGIVGMRARAALYGGTFDAGPRTPTGWRVHAVLQNFQPSATADGGAA